MAEYIKPLPDLSDPHTRTFWDYLKQHELRMQKCQDCGHIRFPVTPVCTDCLSDRTEWAKLSGKGTVWSWNVFYHVYGKGWQDEMPYNVVYVLLDEGIGLISHLQDIKNEEITFDMPVEVVFDDVTPEVTLHKFRPAQSVKA
jgi:uncharacterized OB-fold protein